MFDDIILSHTGGVAELADALDLGSSDLTVVQVQFLSPPLSDEGLIATCCKSFFRFLAY